MRSTTGAASLLSYGYAVSGGYRTSAHGARVYATFITVLMSAATVSHAQSKDDGLWAVNELSSELLECSQYLMISSICMKDFPNPTAPALAADYLASANKAGEMALSLAARAGISVEASEARMRLIRNDMKTIDNDCGSASILIEWYATFCKAMLQDPTPRLKELAQCAATKRTLPCGGR